MSKDVEQLHVKSVISTLHAKNICVIFFVSQLEKQVWKNKQTVSRSVSVSRSCYCASLSRLTGTHQYNWSVIITNTCAFPSVTCQTACFENRLLSLSLSVLMIPTFPPNADKSLHTTQCTHVYTVLLSILSPVVPCVAEHQQVGRQPIRAAVAALRGNGGDVCSLTKVDLQPLISVWTERRPTSGTWRKKERNTFSASREESSDFSQRKINICALLNTD